MVPCLEVVWVCIVDVFSVLVEYLKFEEVDALLEEVYVSKTLKMKYKFCPCSV